MDGLLAIYKPRKMVSKNVSRQLQKILGKKNPLGHVGTLDPMAEGVLPIVLGKATRLQDYLLNSTKIYDFTMRLGVHTDSLDLEGNTLFEEEPKSFDDLLLSESIAGMIGRQIQIPPIYSAIKWQGKPLYEYARAGRAAEVPLHELGRDVEIFSAEVLDWSADQIKVRVVCSKGTYIRVFAYDLAKKLGNFGVVTELTRRFSAGIAIEQCVRIDDLLTLDDITRNLIPIEDLHTGLNKVQVSNEVATKILQGQKQIVAFPDVDNTILGDLSPKHDEVLLIGDECKAFGIGAIIESSIEGNYNKKLIKLKRGL